MVRSLAARGHRAIAVDLVGFGRSDKPAARTDYTLEAHIDWLSQWLTAMDLADVTLYCQDWGGLAGLQVLPAHGDRFARVIASNTASFPAVITTGVGFPSTGSVTTWRSKAQSRSH